MANDILAEWGSVTKPTFTGTSMAPAAGRIAARFDNTTIRAPRFKISVTLKTGASAPTDGGQILVYIVEQSGDGTKNIVMDRHGNVDAAVSVQPRNSILLGAITVSNSTNANFDGQWDYAPLAMTKYFSVLLWNVCGQALSSTPTDFEIQITPVWDEVQ